LNYQSGSTKPDFGAKQCTEEDRDVGTDPLHTALRLCTNHQELTKCHCRFLVAREEHPHGSVELCHCDVDLVCRSHCPTCSDGNNHNSTAAICPVMKSQSDMQGTMLSSESVGAGVLHTEGRLSRKYSEICKPQWSVRVEYFRLHNYRPNLPIHFQPTRSTHGHSQTSFLSLPSVCPTMEGLR